jgi:kynurenine formamidase
MSARPGQFIDIVETGWSRERGSETAMDPKYGALQSKIWSVLRNESLKALGA